MVFEVLSPSSNLSTDIDLPNRPTSLRTLLQQRQPSLNLQCYQSDDWIVKFCWELHISKHRHRNKHAALKLLTSAATSKHYQNISLQTFQQYVAFIAYASTKKWTVNPTCTHTKCWPYQKLLMLTSCKARIASNTTQFSYQVLIDEAGGSPLLSICLLKEMR